LKNGEWRNAQIRLDFDENTWILFYGKNNRLDHCSFTDKKNMGVLLAVILDDERSRENFHSIDKNYFGTRLPLASNTGEIIRVGVSQHAQFNSNTQIVENVFEECDGEAEVISIKSGSNVVKGNIIKSSQGSIVLRHGDYNTVTNNIIIGGGKPGTGGIRLVGKGQWVVNNALLGCRGIDFRSPLTVMNGIPNSPANRYVQVTDAVIANNTFFDCSPVSFCDGSDAERTLPPDNIEFMNNYFLNRQDSIIYRTFDDVSGFDFANNAVEGSNKQTLFPGFTRVASNEKENENMLDSKPRIPKGTEAGDSLQTIALGRLGHELSSNIGFSDITLLKQIEKGIPKNTGAAWFKKEKKSPTAPVTVNCKNSQEVYSQLSNPKSVHIVLTGTTYNFNRSLVISKYVKISSRQRVTFSSDAIHSIFELSGGGNLIIDKAMIDGKDVRAHNFITTDSTGPVNHFNLKINNSLIENLKGSNGCKNFFHARKSIVADSIIISENKFKNNDVDYFEMNSEKDDKGYYTAERIIIRNNKFSNTTGVLLDIYRGGNDESTLGPNLVVDSNFFNDCKGSPGEPFINLVGVQRSWITNNKFSNVNENSTLINYSDRVRAYHFIIDNRIKSSGLIKSNDFVVNQKNIIQ
jgi:poly(beta-D-mannuronate) lyase